MHVEGLIISRLASSGGYRLLSAYCPSFLCTRLCQNTVIRHHSCSVLTMADAKAEDTKPEGTQPEGTQPAGGSFVDKMADNSAWKKATSIYDFSVVDNGGNVVSLDKYKGHVCLIVNVASKCGFTESNQSQLQALHEEFAETKGLRILAFPCNQFGGQEPGTGDEIKTFCIRKYGVKFDLFEKVDVNGKGAIPLYNYLKMKQGGILGSFIKWNFTKFLVNKEGQPVKRYAPSTAPNSIRGDLEPYW